MVLLTKGGWWDGYILDLIDEINQKDVLIKKLQLQIQKQQEENDKLKKTIQAMRDKEKL